MDEMTTWTPELVSLELIDSNPWQGRLDEDAVHVKTLAEDIAENTLLQPGLGRRVNGRVQLAFAHSRLAAFRFLDEAFGTSGGNGQAGELYTQFPVILRELSDRQMSDYAAAENAKRKNLTSIETAQAIQKRITDFGLTQIEAGRPFGYTNQGTVANLLRLLDLPDVVRRQLQERVLPERLARAMVPFARILPKEVVEIATQVAAAPESEREEQFNEAIGYLLDEHGEDMHKNSLWPFDWQAGEAVLDGQTETLPKCQTCDYRIELRHQMCCTRRVCFQSKTQLWTEHELARLSKELGLPIGEPEAVKVLDLDWRNEQTARNYMKRKSKPDLYLLPASQPSNHFNYNLLKSNFVVLGSTNPHLFNTKETPMSMMAGKVAPTAPEESPAARAKRIELEEQEAEERRAARSAIRKARHDLVWLIMHNAEMLAVDLPITGGIATYCAELTQRCTTNPQYEWPEYEAAFAPLRTKMVGAMNRIKRDGDDFEKREFILARRFADGISGYKAEEQFNWTRGCEKVKDIAEELGLALPKDWDQPPVHKTPTNCHVCGQFTPGDKITGVDEKHGWVVDTSLVPTGFVTCSDKCRNDTMKKYLGEASIYGSKPKPRAKAKPMKKATPKRGKK